MSSSEFDPRVHPFQIQIPASEIDALRARLRTTRFPIPLPRDDWDTGVPVAVLRVLIHGWIAHDWRSSEARLNLRRQIITRVDAQAIHAVHVRSAAPAATPLLMLHGWPGSFLEFEGLIDPLTAPEHHGGDAGDAFNVVIPSHPGFGFSTPLAEGAWGVQRVATAYLELMTRLGYPSFAVQGGDYGALVAAELARLSPERIIGVHVNGSIGFPFPLPSEASETFTAIESDRLRRIREFMERESGYIAIQSTRPGLIGAMTADSPLGLLAWLYDKLQAWTYPEQTDAVGILGEQFVFDNACLYWFTTAGGSAADVTYAQPSLTGGEQRPADVPTAVLNFAHDVALRSVHEQAHRITRWTDVQDRGGHFAALEEPERLLRDIREFFRTPGQRTNPVTQP